MLFNSGTLTNECLQCLHSSLINRLPIDGAKSTQTIVRVQSIITFLNLLAILDISRINEKFNMGISYGAKDNFFCIFICPDLHSYTFETLWPPQVKVGDASAGSLNVFVIKCLSRWWTQVPYHIYSRNVYCIPIFFWHRAIIDVIEKTDEKRVSGLSRLCPLDPQGHRNYILLVTSPFVCWNYAWRNKNGSKHFFPNSVPKCYVWSDYWLYLSFSILCQIAFKDLDN